MAVVRAESGSTPLARIWPWVVLLAFQPLKSEKLRKTSELGYMILTILLLVHIPVNNVLVG